MPIIIERSKDVKVIKVNYDDNEIKSLDYAKNDLASIFSHWDSSLKKNVITENK